MGGHARTRCRATGLEVQTITKLEVVVAKYRFGQLSGSCTDVTLWQDVLDGPESVIMGDVSVQ